MGSSAPPPKADTGSLALAGLAVVNPLAAVAYESSYGVRKDADPATAANAAQSKAEHDQAQTQAAIAKAQRDAQVAADQETLALARRSGFASTVLTTPQDRLATATGQPRTLIGG